MSHLFTYGQQDFNKNIEVVEQDLTGDLDIILEKVMEWEHFNSNSKIKWEWIDHEKNDLIPYLKGESVPKTKFKKVALLL